MQNTKYHFTRRGLIAAGGIGATSLLLSPSATMAASTNTTAPLMVTSATVVTFSLDFAKRFINALPASFALNTAAPLGGTMIAVAFDSRAIAWTGDPVVMSNGRRLVAADVVATSDGISFTIPEEVRSKSLAGAIPVRPTVAYPSENIGALTASVVTVALGSERLTAAFSADAQSASGTAWGGEIDVSWQSRFIADDEVYVVPATVALTSVGPGPIPAGTVIEVVSDAVLAGTVGITAGESCPGDTLHDIPPNDPAAGPASVTSSTAIGGGVRTTQLAISEDVAAGATLTLCLDPAERTVRAKTKAVTYARVSLVPPTAARLMQRGTGSESISTLCAGGLPFSADIFTGEV